MFENLDARLLARRLRDAGYSFESVADRLGDAAIDALARNTTPATRDALGADTDAQADLIRLFMLHDALPADRVARALGQPAPWVDAGLLAAVAPGGATDLVAAVEIRPYAATSDPGTPGAFDGWVAHDLLPTLDGRLDRPRPDYVLGLSPASSTLAQMTIRRPVGSALDLGTGCGVQSLHLATHADRVVATDLNPRAVSFARLTGALNELILDVREGSLYEPVSDETIDLIVTNPPYVMSPPTGERLVSREGGFTGDRLVEQVVRGGGARLNPGGTLQVLGNWAMTDDASWQDRLAGWIRPTGADALVLQRERLDVYEYIEVWLHDAGLVGDPSYATRYREWLDYFAAQGITGVGMGWIMLHNAGRDQPDLTFEEWPHAVVQPVGVAFAAHQAGVADADIGDDDLLEATWVLHPGVDLETLGRPGEADPEHVVYRQRYGFGRAVEVDTALGAVLGASDGELDTATLITAVADILDADAEALADELLPRLRELIRQGYLSREGGPAT